MKRATSACSGMHAMWAALVLAFLAPAALLAEDGAGRAGSVSTTYGQLPLHFEPNLGQTDGRVRFLSRGSGYTLFLTDQEWVLALRSVLPMAEATSPAPGLGPAPSGQAPVTTAVLRLKLQGANRKAEVVGEEELPGRSHYLKGNDPKKWVRGVKQYRRVQYRGVYPGVDLVFYGNQGLLEHDFVVSPGADPKAIRLKVEGGKRVRLDQVGNLVVETGGGEVVQRAPVMYQEAGGVRREVKGRFARRGPRVVGFEVGAYDHSQPLVIDPVLVYSTYLGGSGFESSVPAALAVDASGSAYVTGATPSTDFPTVSALQSTRQGTSDVFVTKLSPSGSALQFSTYLGGNGSETAGRVAVDASGSAYVAGSTDSTDFPTVNPFQAASGGQRDGFVSKLSPSGSTLLFSTYLGGSGVDAAHAIALDTSANAYVAGSTASPNFPVANAFQPVNAGGTDAFVSKLSSSGSLVYSTYLGGSGAEPGGFYILDARISVDASGSAYVAGATWSQDFPIVNALQGTKRAGSDCFLSKLTPGGSALVYSTYLGGSDGDCDVSGFTRVGLAVDASGAAYLASRTASSDFPTQNAFQPTIVGSSGAFSGFLAKVDASGSALVYSTYLGVRSYMEVMGVAVDGAGSAYVIGNAEQGVIPIVNAFQPVARGYDVFVTKFQPSGTSLAYSTFLGGSNQDGGGDIHVDASGSAFVVGATRSTDFWTVAPAQASLRGESDLFIAKLGDAVSGPALSIADTTVVEGDSGTTDAVVGVTLSQAATETVTVGYRTSPGTALQGYDFVATQGTLTFPPGTTSQNAVVPVIGDAAAEADERFEVGLVAASVPLASAFATVTIANDDVPGLAIADLSVSEGSTRNAVFRVNLDSPRSQTVTVDYATADATAMAGPDYTSTAGTLTFTPGRTIHSIYVPVVTDAVAEGSETFMVTLSNPVNAALARATAAGTIADPPAAQRVRMWRSYNPTAYYHFFTSSEGEFNAAVANGYRDETTGNTTFYVWNVEQANAVPLFRMYNPVSGRHYYTAGEYWGCPARC